MDEETRPDTPLKNNVWIPIEHIIEPLGTAPLLPPPLPCETLSQCRAVPDVIEFQANSERPLLLPSFPSSDFFRLRLRANSRLEV